MAVDAGFRDHFTVGTPDVGEFTALRMEHAICVAEVT